MKKYMFYILISLSLAFFACDADIQSSASFTVSASEAPFGSQITFNASASDGPITSYEWNFGDGTYGTGQIVNHIYGEAKVFTVTLTIRDSGGGSKTSTAQVDIYREGKMLVLTKTYADQQENSVYVDSIVEQDPILGTATVLIGHYNLDRSVKNLVFWVAPPANMEYMDYSTVNYQADILSQQDSKVLFRLYDPDWLCFHSKGKTLRVRLKLLNYGAGSLAVEIPTGVDCYTDKRFNLTPYPANCEIVLSKYHDE